MKDRYITYRLGDNDFGDPMKNAARWLFNDIGAEGVKEATDEMLLKAMASHMAGEVVASNILWCCQKPPATAFDYDWYFKYFVSAKIDRTDEGATADGDHGYVSIDCATGYIWTH